MARDFPLAGGVPPGTLYGPSGEIVESQPRFEREYLGEFVEGSYDGIDRSVDYSRLRGYASTRESVVAFIKEKFGVEVRIGPERDDGEIEILIRCYREQIKAVRNLRERIHMGLEEIRPAGVEFRLGFQVKTLGLWPAGGTDVE